jgi:hypothetical protein
MGRKPDPSRFISVFVSIAILAANRVENILAKGQ